MATGIIGIDCATQQKNIGLAFGFFENGKARIEEVGIGSNNISIVDSVVDWISLASTTLFAIDAPLGWPMDLGDILHTHQAGQAITIEPNQLFRREADRFIKEKIGKQPLDVGADRIARTAHAALKLLEEIRKRTGEAIPLVWESRISKRISAIEVYPAATLLAHGINVPEYKRKDGQNARKLLLKELRKHIELSVDISLMEENDDALDAVVCALAGADFLCGNVYDPRDIDLAKKDGWIWVNWTLDKLTKAKPYNTEVLAHIRAVSTC